MTKRNKSVSTWYVDLSRGRHQRSFLNARKHHHIFSMVLGGALYRAPVPKHVGNILDLGTGTGAWAIDIAEYECHF